MVTRLTNVDAPLWTPTKSGAQQTRMHAFIRALQDKRVLPGDIETSHDFQRWSVGHIETFWAEVWRAARRFDVRRKSHASTTTIR